MIYNVHETDRSVSVCAFVFEPDGTIRDTFVSMRTAPVSGGELFNTSVVQVIIVSSTGFIRCNSTSRFYCLV